MTSRRAFIAAGAALAASSDGFAIAAADEADPERTVAPFDLGALMARLNEPAKHKQVFATAHVTDGVVLAYINNSMNAYEKGFGEGPGALRPAAVFYGHGVVLALDDYAWKTYKIADAMKRAGEAVNVQARDVNPYWHAPDGQNSLDDLAARGAIFMACNNALHGVARLLAQGGGNGDDTYADLRKHLIPGVILVPAGVAAINAAQEARFTFFQAAI
jgi:intracellular sulfur oxidation DsrE/DsrF family protein